MRRGDSGICLSCRKRRVEGALGMRVVVRVVLLSAVASACVAQTASAAWKQPAGGASPINQADNQDAIDPSLTSIGGVPYVAWTEHDGTNSELRVSRLNAAGTAWEQVVGGAS